MHGPRKRHVTYTSKTIACKTGLGHKIGALPWLSAIIMIINFVLSNLELVVTDSAVTHQSKCFGFGTCLHYAHLKS